MEIKSRKLSRLSHPDAPHECGGPGLFGLACLSSHLEPPINPAPHAESLPPPLLSTEPVSWITPGLKTKLLCHGGFRGVTYLLRQEGNDQFLEVAEAPEDMEATFPVHRPGNYSCSYRTHAAGAPSEPSATVTVEELGECVDDPRGIPGIGGSWKSELCLPSPSTLNNLAQNWVGETVVTQLDGSHLT